MNQNISYRIEARALRALAEWKALFTEQVSPKAKELASQSDSDGLITLDHYQQAARDAVQLLADVVSEEDSGDGHQKAA